MLLFRLYEKVTKKYPREPRPSGLPGSGSKFRAVDFLIRLQALFLSEKLLENRRFVPYSSEYFESVRDGGFTVQGFVGIYKKASFDLSGQ